jgi:tripartite-type tricarboxylate transporter receptor subunit TctC
MPFKFPTPLDLGRRTSLTRWALICGLGALGLSTVPARAQAPAFPSKTVTLIVPFAPGGNLDVVARTLAPALERALGQSVVVDNRAGAGGSIGAAVVARAQADGHTLLVTTPNAVAVLPQMTKTPYQLAAFQSVGLMATTPLVVVVKASSRFTDVKALLSEAAAKRGQVSVGHAGPGTTSHLAALQLETAANVDFNTVPYKGAGPALVDLIGGQIDMVVDQLSSSTAQLQSGALRALAVMSRERDANLPNVPTLREAGLVNFEATTATGLLAPANTPKAVIDILNTALRKALSEEAVKTRLTQLGSPPRPTSADEWQQMLQQEETRAIAQAKAGKLKAD